MQRLEFSGAVRLIYMSLGVKRLIWAVCSVVWGGVGWVRASMTYTRSRTHPTPHPLTTLYTAHIKFLYNSFLRFHVQPEDGYCWKAETCSCTLGSNVNTHLQSNKTSCVRQET